RSGAPWTTNRIDMPYPTTPSRTTAAKRRRSTVAAIAPTTSRAAIGTWAAELSVERGQPGHQAPLAIAIVGAATAVTRMTATYTGSEPGCTTPVTRSANRDRPRTDAS